jgi:septal ring factor EnvC (AmiA/AmiB activator)
MNPSLLQQPFFQVTIPLMVTFIATIWLAGWSQNKRIDEMAKRLDGWIDETSKHLDEMAKRLDGRIDETNKRLEMRIDEIGRRFDDVIARLIRIEQKLDNHEERIVRLEERTSPLVRR